MQIFFECSEQCRSRPIAPSTGASIHFVHIQDVRELGSKPLSHILEIAALYITEPESTTPTTASQSAAADTINSAETLSPPPPPPMKSIFLGTMQVDCETDAMTCSLPLRTAGMQYITYYFPVHTAGPTHSLACMGRR